MKRIPWHRLGSARYRARDLAAHAGGGTDGRLVAGLDQTTAYVRDRFERLGVRLGTSNPAAVFVSLATLEVALDLARNGRTNEVLTPDAYTELVGVLRTLELAVAELAPEEARS